MATLQKDHLARLFGVFPQAWYRESKVIHRATFHCG
ncbi:hypothetical protein Deipe_1738 [Deinococcus peraridilitoris DSM 19664]|uniref:Uncharacterized protein n=1 Tax=Deinococcus peraridilitoris (strain DSM 19664 / LMG 22246 / CIP 109416 / KR-200) TaxID=937777 RepID=L0A259_DEIPD|nr:hypothetical protein Deipe_1738 [Deinococcus peraridilitoris DSM 19664]